MKTIYLSLFATLFLYSCSQPVDQAAIKSEIEKVNQEFANAVSARNTDALTQLYTEDARLMFPHMPAVRGRENIKGFFKQSFDAGITGIKLTTEEVNATNEFAIEFGRYELFAGEQTIDEGKYLVEWRKVDGKWLLHQDMPSTDLPLPQPIAHRE